MHTRPIAADQDRPHRARSGDASFLPPRTSSRRFTGALCGAVFSNSGFSRASPAIAIIASTNASNVSLLSVSVGSIIKASATMSGKYTVGGWKL